MKTTPNDGGPAFPYGEGLHPSPGMTLRDHFAGLAMQNLVAGPAARMLANNDGRYKPGENWAAVVAANAYGFADAMLLERQRNDPERTTL